MDCQPRTSDSPLGIGSYHYQDATPRRRSNRRHQSCHYRALPSACAGQPSRPRYVPLRSVTSDCSGSNRCQALAETHSRPPALASRPLTWKAKVGYVVGTTGSTRGMVLARSMAPTRWRSAPLRAVPCWQMATPPRRILALSRAGFSRCLYRGSTAPGDADWPRQQAVKQALFFPGSGRLNNRQGSPKTRPQCAPRNPNSLPRPVPQAVIFHVEPDQITAHCQANRRRRYAHLRTVTLLVRSPANGLRRRFTALPMRSIFAPYRCALNVCQNDK